VTSRNAVLAMPHILVADDDEINVVLLREALESAGFRVTAVADGSAAVQLAAKTAFDCALLDVVMPGLDGYEVCRALRALEGMRHIPIIMITSQDDSASIDQAYDAGATDFVAKPVNWHLVPHRLRYVLRSAANESRVRDLAYRDGVTALPNRSAAMLFVDDLLGAARSDAANADPENAAAGQRGDDTTTHVALLCVDCSAIGRIAETFGTSVADGALRVVAGRLPGVVLSVADAGIRFQVARTGDAEFSIAAAAPEPERFAERLADAISLAFREPLALEQHAFSVEPTIGIATHRGPHGSASSLLMRAATARDHVRTLGHGAHAAYTSEMGAAARDRIALDVELRRAIHDEEFELFYQPKLRLDGERLAGVEALLRWHHPDRGIVSPAAFIPLAERSGLILDIDCAVIRMACRQLWHWQSAGLTTSIAINLSGRHFLYGDPAEAIARECAAAGVDTNRLVVEVTESVLMKDRARAATGLRRLRALGCRVAIDDFGTGYSSLAYLREFPADMLKIDRAFITRLGAHGGDEAIVEAILSLARSLGLCVTAEGVETKTQLAWLQARGCEEAQGYLISPPVPGHRILQRYANGEPGQTSQSARA
jgi:diguanylate cyclase